MKKILDDYSQIINVTPEVEKIETGKDQSQLSLDKSESPLTSHK
jgi:hypothetical protein